MKKWKERLNVFDIRWRGGSGWVSSFHTLFHTYIHSPTFFLFFPTAFLSSLRFYSYYYYSLSSQSISRFSLLLLVVLQLILHIYMLSWKHSWLHHTLTIIIIISPFSSSVERRSSSCNFFSLYLYTWKYCAHLQRILQKKTTKSKQFFNVALYMFCSRKFFPWIPSLFLTTTPPEIKVHSLLRK